MNNLETKLDAILQNQVEMRQDIHKLDARVNKLDARVDTLDETMIARMDTLNENYKRLNAKVDFHHMEMNRRFGEMDAKLDRYHDELHESLVDIADMFHSIFSTMPVV